MNHRSTCLHICAGIDNLRAMTLAQTWSHSRHQTFILCKKSQMRKKVTLVHTYLIAFQSQKKNKGGTHHTQPRITHRHSLLRLHITHKHTSHTQVTHWHTSHTRTHKQRNTSHRHSSLRLHIRGKHHTWALITHSNTSHRGKCTLLRGIHHAQSLGTHNTQEHITQRHVYITHRLHILAHITHRDTCIINRGAYHTEALITKATYYTEAHIDTEAHFNSQAHIHSGTHLTQRHTSHTHTGNWCHL